MFLNGDRLLVRRQGEERWCFALGGADGATANIVWPAEQLATDPDSPVLAFTPATDCSSVVWITIVDLDEWEALVYEWLSPISCAHQFPSSFGQARSAIRAVVKDATPKPLLKEAAMNCFWDF